MGQMLSLLGNTPSGTPPDPPLPQASSITASPRSALLVENDKSLLRSLRHLLEREGYVIRTASNGAEGLRLFRDCAPFNVVIINYFVPPTEGGQVDCLAFQQTTSMELAMEIHTIDPSQGIVIVALDYQQPGNVPRPAEAMHIPLVISTNILQFRGLLEKIEIDRAIKMLTPSERLKLQQAAKFRIRGLGRAAQGKDWEDLLGEALCRTLIGAEDIQNGRHWNRKVPFVQHLAGAMKSIASLWKRQFREQDTYLVAELTICTAEGQGHSPIDHVASPLPSADQGLIEKDDETRILAMFGDDPDATVVLNGWMDGLNKNDIMVKHGLEAKKYASAVRRIRQKVAARENSVRATNK
jgi:CheY-like chemotaxis protein